MGTFKTKNFKFLTFPVAILRKAEERLTCDLLTGVCISKRILPRSIGNRSDVYRGKSKVFNVLSVSEQTRTVELIWKL